MQMNLPILHLDDHMVVVNKPSGLLMHRSGLDPKATEFLMQTVRDQLGRHVYPVHRLDRATSGAVILAFDAENARALSEQFAQGRVEKTYIAVVRGTPLEQFQVDHPLKEELDRKTDRLARKDKPAQAAITQFMRLGQVEFPVCVDKFPSARYALIKAQPKTGRKHQIRRHSAHAGHPLIGDVTYGSGRHNRFFRERFGVHRLLLACVKIGFFHPQTNNFMSIKAPLSEDFSGLLAQLGWGLPE